MRSVMRKVVCPSTCSLCARKLRFSIK